MSDDERSGVPVSIYVLPSQEGAPPRAVIGVGEPAEVVPGAEVMAGSLATWSRDSGTWLTQEGIPVPPDIAEAVTEHARSLGVDL